ncbi:gluconokinase [Ameyamaea chiangmaiensis NBRC 103196]|uniref:Gluconokinase n=1 Tax=Ameyamaea chiangmaiensis TaxID=442969 RepID=A0A850P3E0_9PROT|nr:gluconokinase [Ameyamaea chiangmaiensis]MBS4073819.1 gluconokinase [Ameyamaea chiangmaiensis]NVN39185.1 gluconokinase [Ameyamaea chiangmaiensis]GBQ68314.1 gluconokinase [Ameyamaea chiangmaiensis NBRC 103196]
MTAPLPIAEGIRPRILVIMGVSGCGKTTIAEGLQNTLGWPYEEGDRLHPAANVEKMASGIPLTDEDRWPWLDRCRTWIDGHARDGGILTCSALKRSYRDRLRSGGSDVLFVYLKVPEFVLRDRLAHRTGHYMPPSLLPSQLATLEEPGEDEAALWIEVQHTPAEAVARVIGMLRARDGVV